MERTTRQLINDTALARIKEVIRDAFLEGKDDEATAILQSEEYKLLSSGQLRANKAVLGITSYSTVAAGSVVQMVARPQSRSFKAQKFMVASVCSEFFTIGDLRVGNRSQFLQAGDVHASLFSSIGLDELLVDVQRAEDGQVISISLNDPASRYIFGLSIDFDRCETAQDMFVMATNVSGQARTFYGAFLGLVEW